jgi:hypothetical protein
LNQSKLLEAGYEMYEVFQVLVELVAQDVARENVKTKVEERGVVKRGSTSSEWIAEGSEESDTSRSFIQDDRSFCSRH